MDKSKNTTSEEAKKNCEGVKQTVTGLPRVDKWWIMTSLVEPQQRRLGHLMPWLGLYDWSGPRKHEAPFPRK